MVEEEGAGSGARGRREGFSDGRNGEELRDLEAKVVEGFREEDVVDDGFVSVGAGGLNERS